MALGDRTTLNELFVGIKDALKENGVQYNNEPVYRDFRPGDVRHSQADISKAKVKLAFFPLIQLYTVSEERCRGTFERDHKTLSYYWHPLSRGYSPKA